MSRGTGRVDAGAALSLAVALGLVDQRELDLYRALDALRVDVELAVRDVEALLASAGDGMATRVAVDRGAVGARVALLRDRLDRLRELGAGW